MQILIELDEATYRRLEQVAPAKSRARSAFIRAAIQKSLWELEEERTRQAYLEAPDDEPSVHDPETWEPLPFGGFDPPASSVPRRATGGGARTARGDVDLTPAPRARKRGARGASDGMRRK